MAGAPAKSRSLAFTLTVVFVSVATLAAALTGNPALAILPILLVAMVAFLLRAPLRVPTLTLLFLGLVLDNPADIGPWKSPLFPLGELLLTQLKKLIPIDILVVTGMDAGLGALMLLHFHRRLKNEPVDSHTYVRAPSELIGACLVSIGAVFFAWFFGLATGGDFKWSLWQLMQMLHMPFVTLAFLILLPGPKVARTVSVIYVVAAVIKAIMATVISRFYENDFMTSHQDSILFATGSAVLALNLLESPKAKMLVINLLIQPIIFLGMHFNDRRLVWVQLALALAVTFLITDWSWVKFRLMRLGLGCIPLGIMYIAVGWSTSGTGVFKPVGILKSMADSKSDDSTLWRDIENFNLHDTLSGNPITGTGLGHAFNEVIALPDVTSVYPLEPYVPHNSMLGLWAYTGYIGFTLWWMLLVVMGYFALRGYRATRDPVFRVACMLTPASQLIYMVQAYGDIGLGVWHGLLIVGSSAAVSSKIAVSVGALAEPVLQPTAEQPATGPGPRVRVEPSERPPADRKGPPKRLGPLTPLE